jgi:hypothetical protein
MEHHVRLGHDDPRLARHPTFVACAFADLVARPEHRPGPETELAPLLECYSRATL